jgi:hypothetical protein
MTLTTARLSAVPEDDVSPRDALAIAQRALGKANGLKADLDEATAEIEHLREDVASLELRLSEHGDDRDYAELTRDDEVGMVREHAFQKASHGSGVAALDYDDIMWEGFDGEPSADYCYTLMNLAADVRGFEVKTPASGNRSLTVDAKEAKRGAVLTLDRGSIGLVGALDVEDVPLDAEIVREITTGESEVDVRIGNRESAREVVDEIRNCGESMASGL